MDFIWTLCGIYLAFTRTRFLDILDITKILGGFYGEFVGLYWDSFHAGAKLLGNFDEELRWKMVRWLMLGHKP